MIGRFCISDTKVKKLFRVSPRPGPIPIGAVSLASEDSLLLSLPIPTAQNQMCEQCATLSLAAAQTTHAHIAAARSPTRSEIITQAMGLIWITFGGLALGVVVCRCSAV